MATLIQKESVVFGKTESTSDGGACFEQLADPSMPRPLRAIFITGPLLEEIGNPDVITVIIKAGIHKED